jgi:chaperone modulatory protein CbpM
MNIQVADSIWLNDNGVCSSEQLAEVSGLSIDEVNDLIDSGVIAPVDPNARPPSFRLHYIVTVNTARRLRDDFELDRHGVALALTLLQRIDELENALQATYVKLGRAFVNRR